MNEEIFYGLMIPFVGTVLGSGCVFFLRKGLSESLQKALSGFAAGVMVAASIWSLIIPSIEQSSHMEKQSFPASFYWFLDWCCILTVIRSYNSSFSYE